MLAAVTGASGHLGAGLIRALIARGWKVRALVYRDTRALDGLDIESVAGDIMDEESLKEAFRGADAVFHLAACISIINRDRGRVMAINVTGVQNVVNACMANGVKRLVHTSSFHARKQEPIDEVLDESRPLIDHANYPPYNLAKARGERIVKAAIKDGLDAIIIIPAGMIGPYDFKPSHFGITLINLCQGRLPALVDAGLDWVDTRDVAEGIIDAYERASCGESYILSGHWASLKEISQQVYRFSGRNPPGVTLPFWAAKLGAPLVSAIDGIRGKRQLFTSISVKELESNRYLSNAKASKELGYNPRPLEETITDTLEWFQINGYVGTEKKEIDK